MSTRQRLTITLDDRVVVVRGWRAAELIREAGGKPIYAGTVGGWMIDRHRLADVLAYLDERNIVFAIEDQCAPNVAESELAEDSEVASFVQRFVESDPTVQLTGWRRSFMRAIARSGRVMLFTPEEVAANADEQSIAELENLATGLAEYVVRVRAAGGLW